MKTFKELFVNEAEKPKISDFDIKRIEQEIESRVSKMIEVKVDISCSVSGDRIKVTSNDLAGSMKPTMFKELKVENFGGDIMRDEPFYWMPIHFSYKHFDGGSNGSKICDFYFKVDGSVENIREYVK